MATPDYIFSTGWYGIPGGPESSSTKVHVVERGKGPICGARIGPKQEFQWCAWDAFREYLSCQKCLAMTVEPDALKMLHLERDAKGLGMKVVPIIKRRRKKAA